MSYQPTVLGRDEAAALAVFDPERFVSLSELRAAVDIATADAAPVDSTLAAIVREAKSTWPRASPWSAHPRFADGVLVLRLRQERTGNVSPWLRRTATAHGLAVLDLVTELVFARAEMQSRFEVADGPPRSRPRRPSRPGSGLEPL